MDPTQLMRIPSGGLTIVRYADFLTFLEQLLRLHFRKLRVLVAFKDMVDMCEDQDSDLFNMMPRYKNV